MASSTSPSAASAHSAAELVGPSSIAAALAGAAQPSGSEGVGPGAAAIAHGVEAAAGREAAAIQAAQALGDVAGDRVNSLEEQKRELTQRKRDVQRAIRAEQKRRKRVMEKAQGLSDQELLSVIATRAAKAKAKAPPSAKAKARAKATASSGSAADGPPAPE